MQLSTFDPGSLRLTIDVEEKWTGVDDGHVAEDDQFSL